MMTIELKYSAKYVNWFGDASEKAERLLRIRRRKGWSDAEKDALWEGHWYVKLEADRMAASARDRGVLLHLGETGLAYSKRIALEAA